jgi:DNA-directed RNA polymerase subunit beta'
MSWSHAKNKKQFLCSYSSTSIRLIQEIQQLLRIVGVSSTITPTETPKREPFWLLNVSIVDLHQFGGFPVHHPDKSSHQYEFLNGDSPDSSMAYSRYRLMPIPSALAGELRTLIGSKEKSLYVTLSKAIERQYVSKETAKTIVGKRLCCTHPLYEKWVQLVNMPGVHFERVKSVEVTEIKEDGYDLTVPGFETFMSQDGIVLSNTMSAFVPLSTEAVDEAKKMYPSRNLFSPATGKIMYTPTHESQLGIHMLTQKGKDTRKVFKTQAEAAKAAEGGKIGMTDVVKIGNRRTTMGRMVVAQALPEEMRADVLTGKTDLDGDGQREMLSKLAKDHKNDFGDSVNRIKDLGNAYVTSAGVSLGLDDLRADKTSRTRILKAADAKVALVMKGGGTKEERQKKAVQIYDKASESMVNTIARTHGAKGTMLHKMMKSGIKPSMGAYRQITMAPMLMMNAKGEVIPTPIRKSYSEGLDVGDYWTSMSGARKGVIQKVQSVQEPGYLTKQVMNSVMNNSVGTPDCGTAKGISLPTDERDILDRYVASDVKAGRKKFKAGTLITPGVRDSLRNNRVGKVVVRSPLRCEHETGVCSKCYGLDEDGNDAPVGKNVGITSAQAVGERSTQLAMRTFHEGGIAPVGRAGKQKAMIADEFNRVQQLVQMYEKIPGSATLSTVGGKVSKVQRDPAGGHNVFVGNTRHYVPQNRGEPAVSVGGRTKKLRSGMQIQRGTPLSAGPINPNELLPLAGINKVQGYLAGELYGLYKGQGIRRRNIETVVKSMTNLTKIGDPGDHSEFIRGDFAPTSKVQALNKKLAAKKLKPIRHRPVLKGVKTLPLDIQTDWVARLNHENLGATVVDAANQGWSSDIHSVHPIPGLAYGAEFGKKEPY